MIANQALFSDLYENFLIFSKLQILDVFHCSESI